MKVKFILCMLTILAIAAGCSSELGSGETYPALEQGNATVVYKIDKVMQNDVDVKPFLPSGFDKVELTLGYKDNQPNMLTFTEVGAPFRVISFNNSDKMEFEWEINTAKSPYQIRMKQTGEVFCNITKDRLITITFSLGCSSNQYEYRLLPVN